MAENIELVDKDVGSVKVCDNDKEGTNEGVRCNTQLSQSKEPGKKGEKSGVECISNTPKPGSAKRSRSPGFENSSLSQNPAAPKFARSCKKCGEIRSSLKLEIANLKKTYASEGKKLRDDVISLKKDKGDLRNSVNFLQRMYTNLLRENAELKSKNAELKKIIMC